MMENSLLIYKKNKSIKKKVRFCWIYWQFRHKRL